MFFLPPRVATHNDNQSTSQFTETRSLTLASYYWSASSQTDTITIGTEPYTEYYVRTYALEPWVLGGMLLAFSTIRKKRQTL